MNVAVKSSQTFAEARDMPNYTKSAEAISRLSPEEFQVTRQNGTERPVENAYWDHDEPGIYPREGTKLELENSSKLASIRH